MYLETLDVYPAWAPEQIHSLITLEKYVVLSSLISVLAVLRETWQRQERGIEYRTHISIKSSLLFI